MEGEAKTNSRQERISRAPGWLSRLSVRLQLRSRSRGPWVRAPHRALGWWLRAWSLLPILCLPLSLTILWSYVFIFFLIFFNVYLFLRQRETEHEQGRVRGRGRQRIGSRLQALSCQHRVRRGALTQKPWDHDLSWSQTLNRLSHPGAPRYPMSFDWSIWSIYIQCYYWKIGI